MINRLFRPLLQGSGIVLSVMIAAAAPVHASVPASSASDQNPRNIHAGVRTELQALMTRVSDNVGTVPNGYHPPY